MGVRTLGQALRLPRAGFARRFGYDALAALDRLVGRSADPRRSYSVRERFRGRFEPSYELSERDSILRSLGPLLADLEDFLRARQCGITALHCRLRHRPARDGEPSWSRLTLRLSAPELAAERFSALLAEYLARLVLPAPVIRCELRSGLLLPFAPGSASLWRAGEHGGEAAREAGAFIERLRARLGADAIHGLCLVGDHRPEAAFRVAEPTVAVTDAGAGLTRAAAHLHRPLWLMRTPERLPGDPPRCELLEGPERIETGWWDGNDVARDYYIARNRKGVRLWIFRERAPPHRWFLQGVFG
jgi:protein ImuB